MIVEDGSIVVNANSYVTRDFFKQYWKDRGQDFSNFEIQIDEWLINTTQYIDFNYKFQGEIVDSTQALQFPRNYCYDNKGNSIASDIIPTQLMYAVCEIAKINKTKKNLNDNSNNLKSKKIGPVSVTYRDGVSVDSYSVSTNLMKSFLASINSLRVNRV